MLLTGGGGFLGSAVARTLLARGLPPAALIAPRSREVDLTDRAATRILFERARPNIIIHCAGAVGGIQANRDHPARLFHENMAMALNVIDECHRARRRQLGPEVLVFIGSMTSYPASAPMPLREDFLWMGPPEPAVAAYGVAKLAAWQMLDAYHREHALPSAYLIPTNLYGPGDNIDDPAVAHVAGSLVKRFCDAQRDGLPEVVCWGTGSPTREFLYIDDAAEAVVRAAERLREPTPVNLGPGAGRTPEHTGEISIKALAEIIASLTGFRGRITWDTSRPDGQPRRALDATRARTILDWTASTPLEDGLRRTIIWYLARRHPRPPLMGTV